MVFFSLHPAGSDKRPTLRLLFSFWAWATVNMLHSAWQHAGFSCFPFFYFLFFIDGSGKQEFVFSDLQKNFD